MFSFIQAIVTGNNGRLYAKTDKPYYVAGELVTGSIICEALSPLSASGIDLKVSGYEKTEWHDLRHRTETIRPAHTDHTGRHHPAQTRQIPQMHRHRAKRTFFSQHMRIYSIQGGMLNPGTYTFPFQYQLPPDCPGSFYERTPLNNVPFGAEYIDNDSYGEGFFDSDDEYEGSVSRGASHYQRSAVLATIMYKLKVTLDINGIFSPDMYARIPLIVHPKLALNLQPAMQTLTKQVTVCCCIDKGACTVCARFDKLAYVAGELADVRCDITNESTSDLTTRVILRRYLNLKSHNSSKNITEDIVQQKYDPVKEKTNSLDRKMPLQLVGEKVKPTTNGQFITCNYEYLVECGVSMGSDIHLKMPLTVYAPQPPPIAQLAVAAPPAVQLPPQQVQMIASPTNQAVQMQVNMPQVQMNVSPQPMQGQPPQQMNMQVSMPGMNIQMNGVPPPQQGQYPPQQQQQYPPQQGQYPPQQQGQYPPQQQQQYPPQQQQQYPPQQQQQYPPQQQGGYPPQQAQVYPASPQQYGSQQPPQYGSGQPGMQVNMQMGGAPMQPQGMQMSNMQMSGNVQTSSTYSSSQTVNGQVVNQQSGYAATNQQF